MDKPQKSKRKGAKSGGKPPLKFLSMEQSQKRTGKFSILEKVYFYFLNN